MITAEELRLGNITNKGKVKALYYDGSIGLDDGIHYDINDLSSIKITPEILEK
jgi:hypothetical protein